MIEMEIMAATLSELLKQKEEIEKKEISIRRKICSLMESEDIKKYESNDLSIKHSSGFRRSSFNTKMLETKYPDVFVDESLWKTTQIDSFVTIKRKKGKS